MVRPGGPRSYRPVDSANGQFRLSGRRDGRASAAGRRPGRQPGPGRAGCTGEATTRPPCSERWTA